MNMSKSTLNNRTPDTCSNTPHSINSAQLINNTEMTINQDLTPLNTSIDQDIKTIKPFTPSQKYDTGNTN